MVGFPTGNPDIVKAAKKIVEEIPKKHAVSPSKTRVFVVPKKPGRKPTVLSSLNKKYPDQLVDAVKKIPVTKGRRENPIPALVKKIKAIVKDPRKVKPNSRVFVTLVTKQNPKKPTKLPVRPSVLNKVPKVVKTTIVPVGRKTVPAVVVPSVKPIQVVPIRSILAPRVVGLLTHGRYWTNDFPVIYNL